MKLAEQNNNFKISIPKDICRINNWVKGTNLLVSQISNGTVQIIEIKEKK